MSTPTTRGIAPVSFDDLAGNVPLVQLRLGGKVDVLLPSGGLDAKDAFASYVNELREADVADIWNDGIEQLAKLSVEPASADNRPVIGVLVPDPFRLVPDAHAGLTMIVREVEAMGCRPLLIPPLADLMLGPRRNERWAGIVAMAKQLDGLAGPGGPDVHPRLYHQTNRYARYPIYPRDRFEADVALATMSSEAFCFGICRSHQLWNAARGGALCQDVLEEGYHHTPQDQALFGLERWEPFVRRDAKGKVIFENRVHFDTNSRIGTDVQKSDLVTNSLHHQIVNKPGAGMQVVGALRDPDTHRDIIEATEDWNVFTTQFHPEERPVGTAERTLFDVLGRRAHIFKMVKELRGRGELSIRALLERMSASKQTFTVSDCDWVQSDLARHLSR